MTLKERKTPENYSRVLSKTMGVSTPNNDDNTHMTQTCDTCGTKLEPFAVCKDGEVIGEELGCPNEGYCEVIVQ